MSRTLLWAAVLAIAGSNLAFDLFAAPTAQRLITKAIGEIEWGNPTFAPPADPIRTPASRLRDGETLLVAARKFLSARFALSFLPLLIVFYLAASRRLTAPRLGTATLLGAFVLIGKVLLWETIWLAVDLHTCF